MGTTQQTGFMAAIWIGSVAGTWLNSQWSIAALHLPMVILLIPTATDQVQALSIEEEKGQL